MPLSHNTCCLPRFSHGSPRLSTLSVRSTVSRSRPRGAAETARHPHGTPLGRSGSAVLPGAGVARSTLLLILICSSQGTGENSGWPGYKAPPSLYQHGLLLSDVHTELENLPQQQMPKPPLRTSLAAASETSRLLSPLSGAHSLATRALPIPAADTPATPRVTLTGFPRPPPRGLLCQRNTDAHTQAVLSPASLSPLPGGLEAVLTALNLYCVRLFLTTEVRSRCWAPLLKTAKEPEGEAQGWRP